MGTVRRDGKWTLEKDQDGVYAICERGEMKARVITDEYEPQGMMDNVQTDMMTETIEVRDFQGAKREFKNYIESAESGGFGIF
jgi:hypothetical protein